MEYALYIASVIGAIALTMMMPRRGYTPRILGALLGAAALGGLWLFLAPMLSGPGALDRSGAPMVYYYLFSGLAIAAAAGVVTHTKPVYSALWFVIVVLASAGLFLTLEAEFVAIAMVIIYGGAILVTYVFVIMLATHSGDPQQTEDAPPYDRIAREPVPAVAAGFLLLAVLLSVAFDADRIKPNSDSRGLAAAAIIDGDANLGLKPILSERPDRRLARRRGDDPADSSALHNVERIGLDLFRGHPLGLELAGVILLVALIGAVVFARVPIETGGE